MEAPMDIFLMIPQQAESNPEHLLDGMSTKALITSWPPLAQVTEVSNSEVKFTVLLDTDEAGFSTAWDVAVCYSSGTEWREVPLSPAPAGATEHFTDLHKVEQKPCHVYFVGSLEVTSTVTFTIKFRRASEQTWLCVKDHQGVPDGVILLKNPTAPIAEVEDLGDLIDGLSSDFKIQKVRSQSPGTSVWDVEAPVGAAVEDKSTFLTTKFGKPWSGDILRWFALIRIWTPWLAPRQGQSHFVLDKEAIVCSFLERLGGRHIVLLAVSGVDDVVTTFKSDPDGNVALQVRNDGSKAGVARVIVALGNTFESANAAAMYHARELVHYMSEATGEEQQELEALKEGVKPQWMENWFDGLTYCTWNGLGQRLTEEKILHAVDTLAANNINITNLIIDDNWQSIDTPPGTQNQFQQGWIEFEAERTAFPHGLKHFITNLRKKNKNLQHIAVWHALLGYWAGISPTGEIARKYKTVEVMREDAERRNLPMGGKMTVVAAEDVGRFYNDFYSFLSNCGIDAVKTDAQFMLDTLVSASARALLTPAYLNAWTIASLRHFSIKAISCMSQTPAIIFRSQLPTNRPPMLVRNSDDFFPSIPSSHPWHVFTNACNALLTQHLNALADWDMFQTSHPYSHFHAAARCISGGPVYITDIPGIHDLTLLRAMTAPSPHGRTLILRPSVPGKTTSPYQSYTDPALLKISTYHGPAITGTPLLGVFNVSARPLAELLHLSLFPGVVDAQPYVVRSHASRRVTKPLQLVDAAQDALIYVTLDVRGCDILSAFPLRGFVRAEGRDALWVASLGLLGQMTGAAAVVSSSLTMVENGRVEVVVSLKALGVLGLYISTLPTLSPASAFLVTLHGQVVPVAVVAPSQDCECVLEIDVEAAWTSMGLRPGWGNEVEVRVSILP